MNIKDKLNMYYTYADIAQSKLIKCAHTDKENNNNTEDYELRKLVGHANLLDKIMDNIDILEQEDITTTSNIEIEYGEDQLSESEDETEEIILLLNNNNNIIFNNNNNKQMPTIWEDFEGEILAENDNYYSINNEYKISSSNNKIDDLSYDSDSDFFNDDDDYSTQFIENAGILAT